MGLGPWPSSRYEDDIIIDKKEKTMKIQDIVLDTMTRAFQNDPNAIHSLICNQVPCNQKMADDKTIVVEDYSQTLMEDNTFRVGLLGIINGILEDAGSDELLTYVWQELPKTNPLRRVLIGFGLRPNERLVNNDKKDN